MFKPAGPILFHSFLALLFLGAYLFAIFPFTSVWGDYRPELVCLLLIYWIVHAPLKVGMVYAAVIGLFQDVVVGTVWGGHMMALVVIAYICSLSYQRIKNYSIWHQAMWVFVLVGVHQVMVNWVQGLAGYRSDTFPLILTTTVSALIWPIVSTVLFRLQRHYHII